MKTPAPVYIGYLLVSQ